MKSSYCNVRSVRSPDLLTEFLQHNRSNVIMAIRIKIPFFNPIPAGYLLAVLQILPELGNAGGRDDELRDITRIENNAVAFRHPQKKLPPVHLQHVRRHVAMQPRPRQGGKDGDKGMAILLEQQRIKPAAVRLNSPLLDMKRFDWAMILIRSATWRMPSLVSAIALSSSFSGLKSCNCTMRPCSQSPTIHSAFVARSGR